MGKEVDKLLGLQGENKLKVWSLIITFFGDAVVSRGGNVSAKTVQSVLSTMGIGAGAVRTAFSRLAGDEWISRQKIGRESFYELADDGYLPFKTAAARIYSPVSRQVYQSGDWLIAVTEQVVKDPWLVRNGIALSANCWLFNAEDNAIAAELGNRDYLQMRGDLGRLPAWINAKLMPDELVQGYRQLQSRFATIKRIDQLSPLDSLVMRCLLVHQWRRLLLRTPALPQELLPDEWPEHSCRQFVSGVYHQLLPNSEAWLDEFASCATGALPKANTKIVFRFTEQFDLAGH